MSVSKALKKRKKDKELYCTNLDESPLSGESDLGFDSNRDSNPLTSRCSEVTDEDSSVPIFPIGIPGRSIPIIIIIIIIIISSGVGFIVQLLQAFRI